MHVAQIELFGKQTLIQYLGCRMLIKESPWDQHLLKEENKSREGGQGKKLNCVAKSLAASADPMRTGPFIPQPESMSGYGCWRRACLVESKPNGAEAVYELKTLSNDSTPSNSWINKFFSEGDCGTIK